MSDTFDALAAQYLGRILELNPVFASSLGADGYDDRLGDFSEARFLSWESEEDEWIARFEGLDDAALSFDERIDRDLALAHLRGGRAMRSWQSWRRMPDGYIGAGLTGVFTLFHHRLNDDEHRCTAAAARLRAVPEALEHARANLDPSLVFDALARRAAGQARAGARYARDLLPAEAESDRTRALLSEAGETAASAYEDFAAWLEDLAGKATGGFAIGEERYSALLRDKELLGYGAEEMRERGREQFAALEEEMRALARRVGGTDDWRAVMQDLNADAPDTPEEMLALYTEWTERSRQFLADNGLVTLPDGERCVVEPSPPFQRPVLAVASYSRPPSFKPSLTGFFFVPYPPDGTTPEDVRKRLETNARPTIPTVAVHEAYPGHHWHLAWMQAHARPLRRVINSSYFSEGWALYAERMMCEQGFFTDPRHEMGHIDARIFRAARIVVDTSLHLGEMTVDEAIEFMMRNASQSEPTARAEVIRYCAWPTQAASYLTGALEIERIREEYLKAGLGDLRSFHDTIAGSGAMPVGLAERAVLGA